MFVFFVTWFREKGLSPPFKAVGLKGGGKERRKEE